MLMPGMTMGNLLRRITKRYPYHDAIIFEGERYKYFEFNARVNRLANGLAGIGLKKGDVVAIFSRNCNEFLESYFACAKIGAILNTVNWRLAGAEVEYMVNQSESKFLIVEARFQDLFSKIYDKINIRKDLVLVIDGEPELPKARKYEEFIASQSDNEPAAMDNISAEDAVMLLYTSGTTGLPKGALISHSNVIWDSLAYLNHFQPTRRDKILVGMPFIHVAGIHMITTTALFKGLPIVIMREWDAEKACELIERERCTMSNILVTPLQMLTNYDKIHQYDLSSLRLVNTAAAKYTSAWCNEVLLKLGIESLTFIYGLTEATPVVTITDFTGEIVGKENLLGWPVWYNDIRIVDEYDKEVKIGEVGELLVKGPNVFMGYYKKEEETKKTIRDGWLYTGDLVRIDEDGCLFFVDRRKDMIKSGGENVFAIEVEMAILKANPKIAEVAVLGLEDPKWGEAVTAVVVLRPGQTTTQEEIIKNTREQLAGFKLPKKVFIVPELVKSISGKTQKHLVRKQLVSS